MTSFARPRRVLLGSAALLALAAGWTWRSYSPRAATYVLAAGDTGPLSMRLRSPAEHDRVRQRFGEPYVLELESNGGALHYYGGAHSRDRGHPQVEDIRGRWKRFRPTVALCEGRQRGYFLGWPFESLTGLPEPALVHALARAGGVPLFSLEPAYAEEVRLLVNEFPPEHVALFFTLRVYASESQGRADPELALDLARKRTDVPPLVGMLETTEAVDALWKRDFARHGDWRTLASVPDSGPLAEIDQASRRIRGEHMVRVLRELVTNGERVFAVVGSGHVIRQEWALRAALGAEPALDQP